MKVSAASRYARAALEAATEAKAYADVIAQAAALAESLADESLAAALASPQLGERSRAALVRNLAKQAKFHPVLTNFLGVVAANNRLALLPAILADIQTMADEAGGTIRAQVQSAATLTDTQKSTLQAHIKAATKAKTVVLETTVNPSLMGGLTAFFAGKVWDASLRGHFQRLRNHLSATVNE